MEFRILGPLEVRNGDRVLEITAPQQRTLLAALLLQANQVLSTEGLIDLLWNPAPPKRAKATVQAYVHRLRRTLLGADRRAAQLLCTRASGYLLEVPAGALDLERFQRLATQGRQALATGQLEEGAALLVRALGLWRGPALADISAQPLQAQARRLDEERLAVLEERIDTDLRLGRHAVLVGELTGLVAEHPLRERLAGLLMVALSRCGRQADALAVYTRTRRRLVEELGIEPGPELQRLQRQILAADPALDAPQRDTAATAAAIMPDGRLGPVPRQLPPDVATFTGRARELNRIVATARRVGTMVLAIHGIGGIGKSALAIHAAHRLAKRYTDGQLYVNLQGATAGLAPLEPLEVLGRFLRALGVSARKVPEQVDEAAARFRSLVADRRVLLVLDNARDSAQVAPLLPASSCCAVLVTSRQLLAGLDGARHLHLDALSPHEAVALLGGLCGRRRVATEPVHAAEVARWCGFLPLALRIAGARLASRPGWPLEALAERLADQHRRLDELELSGLGVRASFAVSHQLLSDSADAVDRAAASAFELLGVLEGPDVGLSAAARLLDRPEEETTRALERLVDAQLLESPTPGRYRLHDLLRLFAREHAAKRYPQADRAAALTRTFHFYVATAWRSYALLRPGHQRLARADPRWTAGGLGLANTPAALEWLEAERANLVAAVAQAAATAGVPQAVVFQLAPALLEFFWIRSHCQDWIDVNRTAIATARRVGNRTAEAQAHNDLGGAYFQQGTYDRADACLRESLALFRELGDAFGEAVCLGNLGHVRRRQGRDVEAMACHEQSLTIRRELGDRHGQASSLTHLGLSHQAQGRYLDAIACHREGLEIFQELGALDDQASCLGNLGWTYEMCGQYDQAIVHLQKSLAICGELGNQHGRAEGLTYLGRVYQGQARHADAVACYRQSLSIFQEIGGLYGQAEALRDLGVTLHALGRKEQARAHWWQALAIFERLQTPEAAEVRSLLAGQPAPAVADPAAAEPPTTRSSPDRGEGVH